MPSPPTARPLKPARDGHASKTATSKNRQPSVRISAACEACKKRKTKCSGGPPPCQLCNSLGTECVIDLSLDMRRRAAFQRTLDESKINQDALDSLISSIRDGPSSRLDALFHFIRTGATNADINDAVHEHLDHIHNDGEEDTDNSNRSNSGPREAASDDAKDGMSLGSDRMDDSLSPEEVARSLNRDAPLRDHQSGSSEPGKSAEQSGRIPISSLLVLLKESTSTEGEKLLRGFLAPESDEQVNVHPWSPTVRSPVEGISRDAGRHEKSKRSYWHPALRVASEGNWPRRESQANLDDSSRSASGEKETRPIKLEDSFSPSIATTNSDVPMDSPPMSPSSALPYVEWISNTPFPAGGTSDWDLCVAQENQLTQLRVPRHLILPLVVSDDSTMSRTYTHYLQAARQMLQDGVPMRDILGPPDSVAVDIFFRPRAGGDRFDCASWACEVCRSYDTDVFVRLACVLLLTHMMRWLLVPTLEHYQSIPDMMKPTPSQCMVPHIGAIETIPLPAVRDAAIHRLRDWLTPLNNAGWSVNWRHEVDSAVKLDPTTGATVLTASFVDHVTKYSNWSVDKSFLTAFPEVTGQIRIHE